MKENPSSYCYLVTVAYDGSDFAGWAIQPNKFTVQGCIRKILIKIFQQKINILATSRTDKGVHALEQKFTFRINLSFSEKKLFDIIKKALSDYLLVKKVQKIDNNFHPIRDVANKEYRYFINTGKINIFQRKYRWEYNLPLEIKKLNSLLQIFQGQHNFFNFSYCRWQDREKVNTEREIISLKTQKNGSIVTISIIAKGFLRYQIRAIIGEVVNCYEKEKNSDYLKEKLTNCDKKNYKYKNIAPASGLYLWKISYNH
ncbi:MAG: tRNA pseudouridine synthase A [Mycoplasmataceae bacterium]|nr:MAG: tRNA pseudouridine synthase A [Mycoplasmataceae bacterium]